MMEKKILVLKNNKMSASLISLITTNTTLTDAKLSYNFLLDATPNNVTITLPDAADYDGQNYAFKRIDSSGTYTVTIQPVNSETIDGASNLSMSTGEIKFLISYNGNWYNFCTSPMIIS